ncbi:MAG: phosphatidate cytidylyltransferase [Firmicutes bacterium]|nr:phosphatidate cytidylyltransferase [Bacillota bacterium]
MKTRLLTSIVLLITLVPAFLLGGLVLDIVLWILTLGATYELHKMYRGMSYQFNSILLLELLYSSLIFFLFIYYSRGVLEIEYLFIGMLFILIVTSSLLVFKEEFKGDNFGELLVSVFYPAIGFGALAWLRNYGIYSIGFLFIITIMTDVFAYMVGIKFGKHRLAIKISPKKSIEGSIGGTFFALIFTLAFIFLLDFDKIAEIHLDLFTSIGLIVFISIVGQVGDLIASKLKRGYGIKDFSNLFPGHGGVMDRFDSTIFAAMVLLLISKVVELL